MLGVLRNPAQHLSASQASEHGVDRLLKSTSTKSLDESLH